MLSLTQETMSYPLFTPEAAETLRDYKIPAPTIAGYLKIPFHALTDLYATGPMAEPHPPRDRPFGGDPLEDHTITLKLSARDLRLIIREGADPMIDCDTILPEGSIVKALATSNPDEYELGDLERAVKRVREKMEELKKAPRVDLDVKNNGIESPTSSKASSPKPSAPVTAIRAPAPSDDIEEEEEDDGTPRSIAEAIASALEAIGDAEEGATSGSGCCD